MKFYLRRVRINQGGYDDSGAYWGIGMPLYHYTAELPFSWCHNDPTGECENPEISDETAYQTYPKCKHCGRSIYRLNNDIDDHIRAYDRDDAKSRILAKYLDAKFSR